MQALPPAQLSLLKLIAREAEQQKLPLYIIGGFVRDLFVGQTGLDFDLVVVGDAIAFARNTARKMGGKITVHSQFGTATWEPDLKMLATVNAGTFKAGDLHPLDFVTARSETYTHPGALPTVKPGSLEEDLHRRDFSINTLALRLDGEHFCELADLLGGLEDIEKKRIHVLHPDSYVDDPTRILRAVRYEQRYNFKIAEEDLRLMQAARGLLNRLSGERLRHELDLMLGETQAGAMLKRLHELDILKSIQPRLPWDDALPDKLESLNLPEPGAWKDIPGLLHIPRRVGLGYLLWLGNLDAAAILELAETLDFTSGLREALLALSSLHQDMDSLTRVKPSQATIRLEEAPLLAVCAAWIGGSGAAREMLGNYLTKWRHIRAGTNGNDLIRLGMEPGPAFKNLLQTLRAAWLDSEIESADEEMRLLEKLILENSREAKK